MPFFFSYDRGKRRRKRGHGPLNFHCFATAGCNPTDRLALGSDMDPSRGGHAFSHGPGNGGELSACRCWAEGHCQSFSEIAV